MSNEPSEKEVYETLNLRMQRLGIRMGLNHRFYWGMAAHFPVVIDMDYRENMATTDGNRITVGPKAAALKFPEMFGLIGRQINRIILHHTSRTLPVKYPEIMAAAQTVEAEMAVPDEFVRVPDGVSAVSVMCAKAGLDTAAKIYLEALKNVELLKALEGLEPADSALPLSESDDPDRVLTGVLASYQAAKMSGRGTLPAGIELFIEKLREPRIPWREILRQYWGSKVGHHDLVTNRFSPAFLSLGMYIPPLAPKHGLPDVVIAIDTSGSMVGEPLIEIISEIRGLAGMASEVWVVMCDAAIQNSILLSDFSDEEIYKLKKAVKGGGGTNFTPVFDWIEEKDLKPQLLLFMTDLMGTFPAETPDYPVLWVTTMKGEVPFGEKLEIPPEEFADKEVIE
ncbi:MAG: hypothetical protein GYA36_19075 [Veillonellaceae bacterium]|nr:hypothetical protein [Veillonellaceae bacterium]